MTISEYFGDWLEVMDSTELEKVLKILPPLYKAKPIVPAFENVFRAFRLCSKEDCRVVFIGQDPYPQKGVATGILFGNNENTEELSPSLQVIINSLSTLEEDLMPFSTFDVTMESWARQGILMINSALTCEMNKIGSHVMLWRPFLSKFLANLSNNKIGVVYVLFGSQAQSFMPYISRKNPIIGTKHPAFYARTGLQMPNNVFSEVNLLIKGEPIHWHTDS